MSIVDSSVAQYCPLRSCDNFACHYVSLFVTETNSHEKSSVIIFSSKVRSIFHRCIRTWFHLILLFYSKRYALFSFDIYFHYVNFTFENRRLNLFILIVISALTLFRKLPIIAWGMKYSNFTYPTVILRIFFGGAYETTKSINSHQLPSPIVPQWYLQVVHPRIQYRDHHHSSELLYKAPRAHSFQF